MKIDVKGFGVVEFPDGMPMDEIKKVIDVQVKKAEVEGSGAWDRFKFGLGNSMRSLAEGAKQVGIGKGLEYLAETVTGKDQDLSTPNPESVRDIEAGHKLPWTDVPYMAGSILGDAAQLALPIGMGAKALSGLGRAAFPLANVAASAGQGALQYVPEDSPDHQRALNAALGGAAAAAGEAVGTGIQRAAGRVADKFSRVTPEAKEMLDQGIRLTPGQAKGYDSGLKKFEDNMAGVPGGGHIAASQQRGIEDWNRHTLKSVSPDPDAVTDIGHKGVSQAHNEFSKAYEAAEDAFVPSDYDPTGMSFADLYAPDGQPINVNIMDDPDRNRLADVFEDVVSRITKNKAGEVLTASVLKQVRRDIDKVISEASTQGKYSLVEALEALRFSVYNSVFEVTGNGKSFEKLNDLAHDYSRYKVVERAAGYKGTDDSVFTPNHLDSAARADSSGATKPAYARGNAVMQAEAEAASKVFDNKLPRVGPGTAQRIAQNSLLGPGVGGSIAASLSGAPGLAALSFGAGVTPSAIAMAMRDGNPIGKALMAGTDFAGQPLGAAGRTANVIAGQYANNAFPPGTVSGYTVPANEQGDKPGGNPDNGDGWRGSGLGGAVNGVSVPTNEQGGTEPRLPEGLKKDLWNSMSDTEKANHRKNSVSQTLNNLSQQFGNAAPVASLAALGNVPGKHSMSDPQIAIPQALYESGVQTVDPARVRMVLEADQDSDLGKQVAILVSAMGKYHPGDRMRTIAANRLAAIVNGSDYAFN